MPKAVRISLANKCQLLFGAAVVLIITAALAVGWLRMQTLVTEGQEGAARKLAVASLARRAELQAADAVEKGEAPVRLRWLGKEDLSQPQKDAFLAGAIERFRGTPRRDEASEWVTAANRESWYRFARAVRASDLARLEAGDARLGSALESPHVGDALQGVLLVELRADAAQKQLLLNRIYIITAGLFAGLLAIGVFWFITTRLILSPVRVLKDVAEKVSEGDLNIRADVNTGDEFEQLAEAFNHMLGHLKLHQDELKSLAKSLDLRLGELAETNVALFQANKMKGEFLANVSHELRTPLNSIIGFAEVLEETLRDRAGPVDEKRKRYVANIISSSRRLLDLITDLLDLARIEAGRLELRVVSMSVSDTVEGLLNVMRPQAEKKGIQLQARIAPGLPVLHTDAGRFHQILFNFLSNAVKFTPEGGTVTVSANLLPGSVVAGVEPPAEAVAAGHGPANGADAAGGPAPPAAAAMEPATGGSPSGQMVVSVSDTGPGIPLDKQELIFEKFTQLDSTVTKEFGGTGLGLAISRELARMLQGRITLDSDEGRGATFSLILPLVLESRSAALMPNLASPSPRAVGAR